MYSNRTQNHGFRQEANVSGKGSAHIGTLPIQGMLLHSEYCLLHACKHLCSQEWVQFNVLEAYSQLTHTTYLKSERASAVAHDGAKPKNLNMHSTKYISCLLGGGLVVCQRDVVS